LSSLQLIADLGEERIHSAPLFDDEGGLTPGRPARLLDLVEGRSGTVLAAGYAVDHLVHHRPPGHPEPGGHGRDRGAMLADLLERPLPGPFGQRGPRRDRRVPLGPRPDLALRVWAAGPYQFPEKGHPAVRDEPARRAPRAALRRRAQRPRLAARRRHCRGIQLVAERGRPGEIYNIGGGTELTNRELTYRLLAVVGRTSR
jgi:hypothetical protein